MLLFRSFLTPLLLDQEVGCRKPFSHAWFRRGYHLTCKVTTCKAKEAVQHCFLFPFSSRWVQQLLSSLLRGVHLRLPRLGKRGHLQGADAAAQQCCCPAVFPLLSYRLLCVRASLTCKEQRTVDFQRCVAIPLRLSELVLLPAATTSPFEFSPRPRLPALLGQRLSLDCVTY